MTNTINTSEIDWSDPDAVLEQYGIGNIDDEFHIGDNTNWDDLCDGDCNTCMTTPIDDFKTKLGAVLCCKQHPETGEINPETNACPEYDMNTGKCRIYNTDNYPLACRNYHCKTHNR